MIAVTWVRQGIGVNREKVVRKSCLQKNRLDHACIDCLVFSRGLMQEEFHRVSTLARLNAVCTKIAKNRGTVHCCFTI